MKGQQENNKSNKGTENLKATCSDQQKNMGYAYMCKENIKAPEPSLSIQVVDYRQQEVC